MSENMFEKATRLKLRFPYRGSISAEDLWDLSLNQINGIYTILRREQKDAGEESLLRENTAAEDLLNLKIEIVKYVFDVKQAEKQAALQRVRNKQEKERLLQILERKQGEKLEALDEATLLARIAELEG